MAHYGQTPMLCPGHPIIWTPNHNQMRKTVSFCGGSNEEMVVAAVGIKPPRTHSGCQADSDLFPDSKVCSLGSVISLHRLQHLQSSDPTFSCNPSMINALILMMPSPYLSMASTLCCLHYNRLLEEMENSREPVQERILFWGKPKSKVNSFHSSESWVSLPRLWNPSFSLPHTLSDLILVICCW